MRRNDIRDRRACLGVADAGLTRLIPRFYEPTVETQLEGLAKPLGATGPYFWVDPREKMVAVMMLQASDIQLRTYYRSLLRNLVYQALL